MPVFDSSSMPLASQNRLAEHFLGQDPSVHGRKWQELWEEGFKPWDRGAPSPALIDLLSERQDVINVPTADGLTKKALVPGCGTGYDVLLLSACGYDSYGLEISPGALEGAKRNEKEVNEDEVYVTREGVKTGCVHWVEGDFFKNDFLEEVKGERMFDFIYDYTACAG